MDTSARSVPTLVACDTAAFLFVGLPFPLVPGSFDRRAELVFERREAGIGREQALVVLLERGLTALKTPDRLDRLAEGGGLGIRWARSSLDPSVDQALIEADRPIQQDVPGSRPATGSRRPP